MVAGMVLRCLVHKRGHDDKWCFIEHLLCRRGVLIGIRSRGREAMCNKVLLK